MKIWPSIIGLLISSIIGELLFGINGLHLFIAMAGAVFNGDA